MVDDPVTAVALERLTIANEARRYAAFDPQVSDGRNTLIMLAEWIEAREAATEASTATEITRLRAEVGRKDAALLYLAETSDDEHVVRKARTALETTP